MEEIKREELDELLNIENDITAALYKGHGAKNRTERKAAKIVYKRAWAAAMYHAEKLEDKTEIDCFCFKELASHICKRELPKETFYKIIELLGVKVN